MERSYTPCEKALGLAKAIAEFKYNYERLRRDKKRQDDELRKRARDRIHAAVVGMPVLYLCAFFFLVSPLAPVTKVWSLLIMTLVIVIQGVALVTMPL